MSGNENDAVDAVRCPDNLLGVFRYTYTDNTGTYCSAVNTSTINTCDSWNLTTIYVNNTECTQKTPFYSSKSDSLGPYSTSVLVKS